MQISINELSVYTGMSYRTIKKRLADLKPEIKGAAHLYRAEDAMPLLFAPDAGQTLQQEKARLTHHQANLLALKEARQKELYIPTDVAVMLCEGLASQAREKITAVSAKVAERHPDIDPVVITDLNRFIEHALAELGEDGIPPEIKKRVDRER